MNLRLAALNPVHHGRALGSTAQEKLDELLDEDPDFCCPVMLVLRFLMLMNLDSSFTNEF